MPAAASPFLGAAPRPRSASRSARPRLHAFCATASSVQLPVRELTAAAFAPFGQVVGPSADGKAYDEEDAQLELGAGRPRFYIMRLPARGMAFTRITHHRRVTQCLGTLGDRPWFMAVSAPSFRAGDTSGGRPPPESLAAFRIPPGVFIKLHAGTWHAGPLFPAAAGSSAGAGHADFYNLELSDTNVTDHHTHDFAAEGLRFELVA